MDREDLRIGSLAFVPDSWIASTWTTERIGRMSPPVEKDKAPQASKTWGAFKQWAQTISSVQLRGALLDRATFYISWHGELRLIEVEEAMPGRPRPH